MSKPRDLAAEAERRADLNAQRAERREKRKNPNGVRKNLSHSPLVRERIRTAMFLNRLTAFIAGRLEMSPHQVSAALGLLKKTIPDLQSIEHSGEVAQEVYMISAEPPTEAEWQAEYGGGKRLDS